MARIKESPHLVPVLIACVLAALTLPVWRWLWGEWWHNEYYSHGLLIVPIALFLAWRRLLNSGENWPTAAQGDNRGLLLLIVGLAGYLYWLADRAYFLAALAMIILIVGLVWMFGGARMTRQLAFPLTFLVFMIPLPFVERATLPLAQLTGLCSGTLTKWMGLDVVINGSAVTLPNTQLVIGAQCSGINSMITLLTLTSLLAYLVSGPSLNRLVLIVLAVPLAMLGNILRVANLLVLARHVGVETAFEFYHNYSGVIIFLLVLVLMIPLTRVLRCNTVRSEVF